jgi:hypothetical protein
MDLLLNSDLRSIEEEEIDNIARDLGMNDYDREEGQQSKGHYLLVF